MIDVNSVTKDIKYIFSYYNLNLSFCWILSNQISFGITNGDYYLGIYEIADSLIFYSHRDYVGPEPTKLINMYDMFHAIFNKFCITYKVNRRT